MQSADIYNFIQPFLDEESDICDICMENNQLIIPTCNRKHMVCIECMKDSNVRVKCPYCRSKRNFIFDNEEYKKIDEICENKIEFNIDVEIIKKCGNFRKLNEKYDDTVMYNIEKILKRSNMLLVEKMRKSGEPVSIFRYIDYFRSEIQTKDDTIMSLFQYFLLQEIIDMKIDTDISIDDYVIMLKHYYGLIYGLELDKENYITIMDEAYQNYKLDIEKDIQNFISKQKAIAEKQNLTQEIDYIVEHKIIKAVSCFNKHTLKEISDFVDEFLLICPASYFYSYEDRILAINNKMKYLLKSRYIIKRDNEDYYEYFYDKISSV